MKQITLIGIPSGTVESQIKWLYDAARELESGTHQNDAVAIANGWTITGAFTITRTLDVTTATLPDVIAFLATCFTDLQKGGANRTQ